MSGWLPPNMLKQFIKASALALFLAIEAHAGSFAFITNQLDNSVSVLDTGKKQVVETIAVSGKPAGVAVNPKLPRVYISTPEGGGFSVLDSDRLEVTGSVKAGGASLGIATDSLGTKVFVADWYENTVDVFDSLTLVRFTLYLLIPLGSWLGGAFVERGLDFILS